MKMRRRILITVITILVLIAFASSPSHAKSVRGLTDTTS